MNQQKKLQVFVSSTYQDLHDERQAAVEAILTAGHIPAGMELFAAGDQSQMNVIKRWIDESDVFLLILGGRYGSIEPSTGKSYIHLEYEYAVSQGKPLFAVVIDEHHRKARVKMLGEDVIETENPAKLREFREQVLQRLVKFWSDPRDIKLAIHETLSEFSRRTDLYGWVRGDRVVDTGSLAEELARLAKENSDLRLEARKRSSAAQLYNGLQFEQLLELLEAETVTINTKVVYDPNDNFVNGLRKLSEDEVVTVTLLDCLWLLRTQLFKGWKVRNNDPNGDVLWSRLKFYGIVQTEGADIRGAVILQTLKLTIDGHRFVLRLQAERENLSLFPYDLDSGEQD